jgi:hypothetical protein
VALVVSFPIVCVGKVAGQNPEQATVSVTVALVVEELEVRPVPLHQIELVRAGDTVAVASFRTGLDGKARETVAPGDYHLRSVSPVRLQGKAYRWNVAVTLVQGGRLDVELTNVNAIAESLSVAAQTPVDASDAEARDSVKRLEAHLYARRDGVRQASPSNMALPQAFDDSIYQIEARFRAVVCVPRWEYANDEIKVGSKDSLGLAAAIAETETQAMVNARQAAGWDLIATHAVQRAEYTGTVYSWRRRTNRC